MEPQGPNFPLGAADAGLALQVQFGRQRSRAAEVRRESTRCSSFNVLMNQTLKNKCALVTGGSRGIGSAIVKRLASADSDRDGMNNWQEWRAGTDPTIAASVLQMLAPTDGVSGITVSWQSVTNRLYTLECWANPVAGSWTQAPFVNVQSNIVGQAGTTSYTDTNAAGVGPFFYRVGVQ